MKKQAVLSLSGGMDSSTLLLHLLANDYEVTALSFDYGQKHNVELERASELVKYINTQFKDKISKIRKDFGPISEFAEEKIWKPTEDEFFIKHQVITLGGLSTLLNSALVTGGEEVPEGHYAEENMKATVVPNRNKIFSSIIQAVALSIAEQKGTDCAIAMGIHAGDHAIYPDCRQEFRDIDFEAFKSGNWGAEKVYHYTPYLSGDKYSILEDGANCCECLGLDFNEVYSRTNTSYKPIWIKDEETTIKAGLQESTPGLGKWYSDYKSASSVERIEAFMKLGKPDPVAYANEQGPVSWDTVVEHVKQTIENYETTRS